MKAKCVKRLLTMGPSVLTTARERSLQSEITRADNLVTRRT